MSAAMLDLRAEAKRFLPEVPAHPHLRASAIATWSGRMVNEHGSARVFEGFADQLARAGFPEEEVRVVRGFADEERRHGALCGAVVEALGGEARANALEEIPFPEHPGATPLEAVLANAISIGCMSETVAVSLIGAERLSMPEGELKALLTEIYADEVGHARFGWTLVQKHVPKLSDASRARLSRYLEIAFRHLEMHELAHLAEDAAPPEEGKELGLCNGGDARSLFFETVTEVIVPGLQKLGLDAERAWIARRTA